MCRCLLAHVLPIFYRKPHLWLQNKRNVFLKNKHTDTYLHVPGMRYPTRHLHVPAIAHMDSGESQHTILSGTMGVMWIANNMASLFHYGSNNLHTRPLRTAAGSWFHHILLFSWRVFTQHKRDPTGYISSLWLWLDRRWFATLGFGPNKKHQAPPRWPK